MSTNILDIYDDFHIDKYNDVDHIAIIIFMKFLFSKRKSLIKIWEIKFDFVDKNISWSRIFLNSKCKTKNASDFSKIVRKYKTILIEFKDHSFITIRCQTLTLAISFNRFLKLFCNESEKISLAINASK